MKFPPVSRHGLTFLLGVALVFTSELCAQTPTSDGPLNAQQVDQLLGPIALYPDALVALILPASTTPGDIVLAARYVNGGGDPDQIDNQPWNDSVKSLAHYPALIKWLDDNLAWTQQLGGAFLNQPDEIMNSVQRLRARAKASGALTSTPQQKLVLDGDDIEIVPAQPDVIYVPYYNPDVVYGPPGYYNGPPYLTFGFGLPVGFWLSYDFNWRSRAIFVGDRQHNWSERRGWSHHPGPGNGNPGNNHGNWHQWKPAVPRPPYSPLPGNHRPNPALNRPRPYPGAAPYPSRNDRPREDHPRPETNSHSPGPDRDRPATPSNNPGLRSDARDNHDPRPQTQNPAPRPALNPPPDNQPRLTRPDRSPSLSPRPENNLRPMPNQPMPSVPPQANRQAPTRPESRPVAPPVHQAAPPPPSSKDNPRDNQPEVQR